MNVQMSPNYHLYFLAEGAHRNVNSAHNRDEPSLICYQEKFDVSLSVASPS